MRHVHSRAEIVGGHGTRLETVVGRIWFIQCIGSCPKSLVAPSDLVDSALVTTTQASRRRTADLVVSVVLLVALGLVAVVAAFIAFIAVFSTDSCGYGGHDPAMCRNGTVVWIIIGYWVALGLVTVTPLVLSVTALARGRRAWPYAAGGILVTVLGGAVAFVVLLTR